MPAAVSWTLIKVALFNKAVSFKIGALHFQESCRWLQLSWVEMAKCQLYFTNKLMNDWYLPETGLAPLLPDTS